VGEAKAAAPHRRVPLAAAKRTIRFCRDGRWRTIISGDDLAKFWFWAKQSAEMVYGDATAVLCAGGWKKTES
jgi:hypothetical protein